MNKMKEYRTKAGITQEALSRRVFVTLNTIRSHEKSKSMPAVDTAIRIARELNTTVEELWGGNVE